MKSTHCLLAAGALCLALGSLAQAEVTITTVSVGDVGNTGEWSGESYGGYGPDRICGAVDYAYNIGKYEVAAGQYGEFLNKVAGVDTYGLYNGDMWASDYGCKIERYTGSGTGGDPDQYRVDANWANRPVNFVGEGPVVVRLAAQNALFTSMQVNVPCGQRFRARW